MKALLAPLAKLYFFARKVNRGSAGRLTLPCVTDGSSSGRANRPDEPSVFGRTRIRAGAIGSLVLLLPALWPLCVNATPINIRDVMNRPEFRGQADQTAAIRAAVEEAQKTRVYNVFFPAGAYTISDTIDLTGKAGISGEGYVRIEQTDPGKDIFISRSAWRMTFSGFHFVGGRDQLALGNANTDTGSLLITDCIFENASGTAVHFLREPAPSRITSNSTIALVQNCEFRNCMQALFTVCDMTFVTDCLLISNPAMRDRAVIENFAGLWLERSLCIPRVTPGNGQRWIDNWSYLACDGMQFAGDDKGDGFPAVYARYNPSNEWGRPVVELNSCQINCGNRAAVYFEEIGGAINVENCRIAGNAAVMEMREGIDYKSYFAAMDHPGGMFYTVWNKLIRINIQDGQARRGTGIPDCLMSGQMGEVRAQGPSPLSGDAAPTSGVWLRGQFVRNRNSDRRVMAEAGGKTSREVPAPTRAEAEPFGWYCVKSGKPGEWKAARFIFDPPVTGETTGGLR